MAVNRLCHCLPSGLHYSVSFLLHSLILQILLLCLSFKTLRYIDSKNPVFFFEKRLHLSHQICQEKHKIYVSLQPRGCRVEKKSRNKFSRCFWSSINIQKTIRSDVQNQCPLFLMTLSSFSQIHHNTWMSRHEGVTFSWYISQSCAAGEDLVLKGQKGSVCLNSRCANL